MSETKTRKIKYLSQPKRLTYTTQNTYFVIRNIQVKNQNKKNCHLLCINDNIDLQPDVSTICALFVSVWPTHLFYLIFDCKLDKAPLY